MATEKETAGQPGQTPPRTRPLDALKSLRFLSPHLAEFRTHIILLAALTAISTLPGLAIPMIAGMAFDQAIAPTDFIPAQDARIKLLFFFLALVFTLEILNFVLSYSRHYFGAVVGQLFAFKLRTKLFDKVVNARYQSFDSTPAGQISGRVFDDAETLESVFFSSEGGIGSMLLAPLVFAAITGVLFFMNWRLAMITLLPTPFLIAAGYYFAKKFRVLSPDAKNKLASSQSILIGDISVLKLIKLSDTGRQESARFKSSAAGYVVSKLALENAMARFFPLVNLITFSGVMFVGASGGVDSIYGSMTPGELITFVAYLAFYYIPLSELSRANYFLQSVSASIDRIRTILDAEDEDRGDETRAFKMKGAIELDSVFFAFPEGKTIFNGFSMKISAGEKVVIKAPNGSGKTTLFNLIARLYEPTSGRIMMDGEEARNIPMGALRTGMGCLPQENLVFNTSAIENVVYGTKELKTEDGRRAIEAAGLDKAFFAWPEGPRKECGEGGSALSGGERRRICLARALARNAPLMLLDEPFDGLDDPEETLRRMISAYPNSTIVIASSSDLPAVEGVREISLPAVS